MSIHFMHSPRTWRSPRLSARERGGGEGGGTFDIAELSAEDQVDVWIQ